MGSLTASDLIMTFPFRLLASLQPEHKELFCVCVCGVCVCECVSLHRHTHTTLVDGYLLFLWPYFHSVGMTTVPHHCTHCRLLEHKVNFTRALLECPLTNPPSPRPPTTIHPPVSTSSPGPPHHTSHRLTQKMRTHTVKE